MVPLWAKASAAPGFGRSPFPETLPPPDSRFDFFSNFLSFFSFFLSFLFSFFSPSFVSCPAADFGFFLIYPALLGFRTLPPPPTPPSPLGLSEGSRGPPPRRTASGEAYSTLSFRPSREWFRGLISEAVACSVDVKSTNAHLREIRHQRPPYKRGGGGGKKHTLYTSRYPRTSPSGSFVSTCLPLAIPSLSILLLLSNRHLLPRRPRSHLPHLPHRR